MNVAGYDDFSQSIAQLPQMLALQFLFEASISSFSEISCRASPGLRITIT
jgi:hypothetical protein